VPCRDVAGLIQYFTLDLSSEKSQRKKQPTYYNNYERRLILLVNLKKYFSLRTIFFLFSESTMINIFILFVIKTTGDSFSDYSFRVQHPVNRDEGPCLWLLCHSAVFSKRTIVFLLRIKLHARHRGFLGARIYPKWRFITTSQGTIACSQQEATGWARIALIYAFYLWIYIHTYVQTKLQKPRFTHVDCNLIAMT
jgi:hypothetical protein